jgi:ribosome small subunit-dependent GTPase A
LSEQQPRSPEHMRVARADRGAATVLSPDGEGTEGPVRVAVPHHLTPVVGDWVVVDGDPPAVTAIQERTSALTRASTSARTEAQVLAANVDVVFVVVGLDAPLRLRRLERTLAVAWGSGAVPAVVLTKADMCPDVGAVLLEAQSVAVGAEVIAVSNVTGEGLDDVLALAAGRTVVMLGPSGAGKTTLVNRLTGEDYATAELRADGKGRHTTTAGQLVPLPGGGVLLDTPGLKTLGLWDDGEGVEAAFSDIGELAAGCRFADCAHDAEPGCAVREGLDPERLASWHKLQQELEVLAARQDARLAAEEKRKKRAHKGRP